jgi:hypothetical protein
MKRTIIWLLSAIAALPACVGDDTGDPGGATDATSDPRWELFKQSAQKIASNPDRYLFGGDMVAVGEDGLRREFERYFGRASAGGGDGGDDDGVATTSSDLTIDRDANGADILLATNYADSSGGRYNLTYCIQRNTFTAAQLAALEPALAAAHDSWNGLVNVSFRHEPAQDATCGAANTSVFYNIRRVTGGSFFASAYFPRDVRGARELLIDDSAFTTTSNGRDLQGIMRHEHGHMLGFRHEHIWIDGCSLEGTASDFGTAVHVTAYDENSIMHYPQCRTPAGGGYRQSQTDYRGAINLYGLATAQIMNL